MKLKRISLSKAKNHECPGIKNDGETWYLAKVMDQWMAGTFSREWYGLHFDTDWGMSGLQFDAPGYNSSNWEELYEIVE